MEIMNNFYALKDATAPTYISVVDPQVTFTYEYLW